MKPNPAAAALCLLTFSLPCLADTFTLKDGTSLEGTILSEAGDTYVLEVQITKSIKDERKVLKTDVVKIDHEQPDIKAFAAIEKLVPTPDLMTVDEYLQQMAAVEKFLKNFRASNNVKAAKAIFETLKAECNQVSEGGVKLNGKIISPSEYQANAYDLDAKVEEAKIRGLVYRYQFLEALREFAIFDRDYRTTVSFGAIAPLMRQVIQSQIAEARQSLLTLDARVKERQVGLQRMDPENRSGTENAIKDETSEIEARYKAEKDAKQSWVTTSPFHKASLEDTVKYGESELARLSTIKTVLGVDGGKAYREAWSIIHKGGNPTAITAALAAAKAAAVAPRYLADLDAASKIKK